MRLTLVCLAVSTASATFDGFFGRPSGKVVDQEKKQELEAKLLRSHALGPRGLDSVASHHEENEQTNEQDNRALWYDEYYEDDDDYYEMMEEMYGDDYMYDDHYLYKKHPKKYSKHHKKGKMGKKGKKAMKWGGKMGKGKKSHKWGGMWKKNMKWGNKKKPMMDDHILDMVFQDDKVFTDDILEDEDCELFVALEEFAFGAWDTHIVSSDPDFPGDEYIWEPKYMQDRSSTDLIDAKFSGYCKMTSNIDAYCQFVIVNNVDDQITLAGTLTTPTDALQSGGTLALTGGTGAMAGVIGEATVFANPIGVHFLEIASRFDVDVTLGIIVCRPQKLPVYEH